MGTLLSNPSFYDHLRHTKRGVIMTLFVLFFPSFSYLSVQSIVLCSSDIAKHRAVHGVPPTKEGSHRSGPGGGGDWLIPSCQSGMKTGATGKMGFRRLFGPFSRLFSDFWAPAGRLFSRRFGFGPRDSFSQVHGTSRHVSTMESADNPSYLAELQRCLEKLQFESTTLRMWYNGLQDSSTSTRCA